MNLLNAFKNEFNPIVSDKYRLKLWLKASTPFSLKVLKWPGFVNATQGQ